MRHMNFPCEHQSPRSMRRRRQVRTLAGLVGVLWLLSLPGRARAEERTPTPTEAVVATTPEAPRSWRCGWGLSWSD